MSNQPNKNLSLTARTSLLIFAKTMAFAFGFALPLLLVRRLDQNDFGLYKQAFLVIGTVSGIMPLGFATSAYYFLPREREKRGAIVLNIMLFNLLVGGIGVLVLLLAPQSLNLILNSKALVPYAPLVGLLILLSIVSYFLEIVSIANQEAKLSTVLIIAAQLMKTSLLLTAAILLPTLTMLLLAAIVHGVLQICVLLVYLRSRFGNFWREFDWGVMRRQLSYGLPLGFSGLLYIVLTDLHNYFVSYRFGTAAFAVYAIGCFSLPLVGIIGESVGPVVIARVAELQKQGQTREIIQTIAGAMRKLALIYFPLYVFLLVVGREFVVFLFTEQYLASWPIFVINLTTLPFLVLIADPVIRAHAEHRFFLLKVRVVTIIGLLAALWLGTKYFGLLGAVSAMVAITVVDRLVEAIKAWRIMRVGWRDLVLIRDVGKIAVVAVAAGSITAMLRVSMAGQRPVVVLIACGLAFGCVYAVLVWLLRVPTSAEIGLVKHWFGRLRRSLPGKRELQTDARGLGAQ
jgi:O-antigen/teichoic acid export membrane protein